MNTFFQYVLPILIIATGIYLSFWTNVIKDSLSATALAAASESQGKIKRPFSFARMQIMWWTLIILSVFCVCYGVNGEVPELSGNLLGLLGISAGTATLGNLIDSNDIEQGKLRQQDRGGSKGFLVDILDDGNGISIHRFQALIFNVSIGFMFISDFFANIHAVPEITSYELGLLGISSAAYLSMKVKENDKPASPPNAAP